MELVYANNPLTYDVASHYTEAFLLTRDLAHAVRSRRDVLRRLLVAEIAERRGEVRVLDLACGPCQSMREALPHITDPSRVRLRALDTDALIQLQNFEYFTNGQSLDWQFETANVLRVEYPEASSDIVYSTGLFDYLSPSTLVSLWRRAYRALRPGGVAFLAVKDGARFCPLFYRWAVPWSQFHIRDEADHRAMARAAMLPEPSQVLRDATGCILFFVVRKP